MSDSPHDLPRLLVVEDNPIDARLLTAALESAGLRSELAASAEEAQSLLDRLHFDLIFVDIGLPGARGDELIEIVSRKYPNTIIVAISGDDDFRTVTSVLREHKAYDYILKPFSPDQIKDVAERTLKIAPLRRGGLTFLESEHHYYASLLATFDWKQEIRARHTDRLATYMLRELNRTLFQGSGPGALLTTLQFLMDQSPPGERLQIEATARQLLDANVSSFARLSESIAAAVEIIGRESGVEKVLEVQEVYGALRPIVQRTSGLLRQTGRNFNVSPLASAATGRVRFDPEPMATVLNELMVNAAKYSREGDTILILLNLVADGFLEIKVVNPAYSDELISEEDPESGFLLFSPFFRLSKAEIEDFPAEEFGYGLGLTVVRKLVEMHRGSVSLVRIKNYLRTDQFDDICATVRLPLLADSVAV